MIQITRLLLGLMLLIGSAGMLLAQGPGPGSILEVTVKGMGHLYPDPQQALLKALAPVAVGKAYTLKNMSSAAAALMDTGWFSDVSMKTETVNGGMCVIFTVTENQVVTSVTCSETQHVSPEVRKWVDKTIRQVVGLPENAKLLKEIKQTIEAQGSLSEFAYTQFTDTQGHLVLNVTFRENPTLTGIIIKGTSPFSSQQLVKVINLTKGKAINDAQAMNALKALVDFYTSKGYANTEMAPPELQADGTLILEVSVPVISDIRIEDNAHVGLPVIQKALTVKVGDFCSSVELANSLKKLNQQCKAGTPPQSINSKYRVEKDAKKNTVVVIFTVESAK